MRYGGGIEEARGPLDEMSFPRDGEEGGCVLLFIGVANVLSDCEEIRVAEVVLIGRVGSVGDGVSFSRNVGRTGRLTGRLSHPLGGGVVFAVGVAAEAGMLESVFLFGGMDVGLGRLVETDGLSFDNFGVSRWARAGLRGGVEFERSQFTTF